MSQACFKAIRDNNLKKFTTELDKFLLKEPKTLRESNEGVEFIKNLLRYSKKSFVFFNVVLDKCASRIRLYDISKIYEGLGEFDDGRIYNLINERYPSIYQSCNYVFNMGIFENHNIKLLSEVVKNKNHLKELCKIDILSYPWVIKELIILDKLDYALEALGDMPYYVFDDDKIKAALDSFYSGLAYLKSNGKNVVPGIEYVMNRVITISCLDVRISSENYTRFLDLLDSPPTEIWLDICEKISIDNKEFFFSEALKNRKNFANVIDIFEKTKYLVDIDRFKKKADLEHIPAPINKYFEEVFCEHLNQKIYDNINKEKTSKVVKKLL